MQSIQETIIEIEGLASSIAVSVNQQNAATQEISQSVSVAADGSKRVTVGFGTVTETIGLTDRESEAVREASNALVTLATSLGSTVETFLQSVQRGAQGAGQKAA